MFNYYLVGAARILLNIVQILRYKRYFVFRYSFPFGRPEGALKATLSLFERVSWSERLNVRGGGGLTFEKPDKRKLKMNKPQRSYKSVICSVVPP